MCMNYLLNQHKSCGVGDGVLDAPIFFHPLNYWGISQQCTPNNYTSKIYQSRHCQPLQIVRGSLLCRKIATLFAGCVVQEASKAVQIFVLRF